MQYATHYHTRYVDVNTYKDKLPGVILRALWILSKGDDSFTAATPIYVSM
jgi:hypothetical protein